MSSKWLLQTRNDVTALTDVETVKAAIRQLHVASPLELKGGAASSHLSLAGAGDLQLQYVESRLPLLPRIFVLLRVSAFLKKTSQDQLVYKDELLEAAKIFTTMVCLQRFLVQHRAHFAICRRSSASATFTCSGCGSTRSS